VINLNSGLTYTINNYNTLSTKLTKNLTLLVELSTKEIQDIKTCQTTIRKLLEYLQEVTIIDHNNNTITKTPIMDITEYLPHPEDYHYPLA
jgi:hypothetical protein